MENEQLTITADAEILSGTEKTAKVASETDKTNQHEAKSATENFYKSFKTKEDFVGAYQSLEREFTRKSQELSDFKKEKPFDAEVETKRFLNEFPEAGVLAEEIAAALESAGDITAGAMERAYLKVLSAKKEGREEFLNRALSDGEIREKAVLRYLNNLPENLPKFSGSGRSPLAEPKRAKSLNEAGVEALQILKR